jgi:hypothetical protein
VIISILLALSLSLTPSARAETPPAKEMTCSSIREYVTTLEYLRAHGEFKIPEKSARALALQVSKGDFTGEASKRNSANCTGSAQRFIKITSSLLAARVFPADAFKMGLEFVTRTDQETASFLTVFLKSYLQEYLDLTLKDSLSLARSLTLEFQGDIETVRKDFEKVVKFCVSENNLNLPRPGCASLATRIAKAGENYKGGVSENFIQMYTFLVSGDGPNLTRADALKLSEQLLPGGKNSSKNLIQAYHYGTSHHGLDLPVREALQFAQEMVLSNSHSSKSQ